MPPPLGAAQLTNRACEPSAFCALLASTLRLATGPGTVAVGVVRSVLVTAERMRMNKMSVANASEVFDFLHSLIEWIRVVYTIYEKVVYRI